MAGAHILYNNLDIFLDMKNWIILAEITDVQARCPHCLPAHRSQFQELDHPSCCSNSFWEGSKPKKCEQA